MLGLKGPQANPLQRMAVSAMPQISLVDWQKYCCTGKLPAVIGQILDQGGLLADLVRGAQLIGGLEPLTATRPGVCDVVVVVDRDITLPTATLNPDGSVTPSRDKAIALCAPMNRALVVEKLRVTGVNDASKAQPFTMPKFKRVNIAGFPDAFCTPFEPADAPGLFSNVEHIVMPPGSGFQVDVENYDPVNVAIFHIFARMWASC